jgi:hypothetical protein
LSRRLRTSLLVVVDAVEWVVDEIIEPVVKGVGDVIQYALDDPIKTIATLAATFASGGAYLWTIPLIEGASVLAKGGNIGDAVKAAVISYASNRCWWLCHNGKHFRCRH